MTHELPKTEYLKRYLENEKDSDRKRKKKAKTLKLKANVPCLKIINEDIDLKSISFGDKAEEDEGDEAPVVAEVIDERPLEIKLKELYESHRWKKIDSNESSQTDLPASQKNSSYFKNSRSRHDSDNDLSPPRGQKRQSDSDISPPRSRKQNKTKHNSNDDVSPPRQAKHNKNKCNSDCDVSPPRIRKTHHSPNKKDSQIKNSRKYNSDSDNSPPRSKSNERHQVKSSLKRHDSDIDISHPSHQSLNKKDRQLKASSRWHDSDSDNSPPRLKKRNKENSQVKSSSKRHDSDSDCSPPRHKEINKNRTAKDSSGKYKSDSNQSPVRHKPGTSRENNKRTRWDSDSDISPPRSPSALSAAKGKDKKLNKTLSGLKAGLQNSKSLQQEVQELRKREKTQLNMLNDEISGRNAGTIIRDRKTGLIRDLNQEQEVKDEENKKAKEYQEKYSRWGKGTEQSQDRLEKFKDDIYEMSKPLARYKDDEDLDERLKSIIHDDDPMSEYMKKKRKKDAPSSYPVYSGPPAPPNRFRINPGYRWDGVDRSNGFEKKYFEKINSTKAVQEEAYLWSVQDM